MPIDPFTDPSDAVDSTAQPPASPAEAPATNPSAAPGAGAPPLSIGQTSPAGPPPPAPPATKQGSLRVPDDMAALHPKGGYIAMRLLSRMQRDLDVLTEGKRAATYPEVEEYLGHALVAEGIAPRGYSAAQAATWWAMGGSAALRAPANGGGDGGLIARGPSETNGGEVIDPEAGPNVVDGGLSSQPGNGGSGGPTPDYSADDSARDAAPDMAAPGVSDASTPPDSASTTENASVAIADPTPATPSPASAKATQAADAKAAKDDGAKAAMDDAIARAKQAIAAAKTIVKTQSPAPFGDDLLKRFGGFGGQKYSFGNDYRTTPQMRAWLPEIEPLAKPDIPYPDGLQINEKRSPAERKKIRDYVAYLYTLPEVKALLDVIAHNEGADKLGYYLSHGKNPPKLPDLDTFHGGRSASGRYQIEPGPWQNFGQKLWSRNDFSPVTQDLIAITQLYQSRAIDALMNGDLSRALTLASGVFASIHVSMDEDHSRYGYQDKNRLQGGPKSPSQPFRDLPAEFARHLALRRAEFS
ncbi:hypothetical protein GCM10009087_25530 [Sphingomonas oligophenolica]|uniref:Uncharacterized protein n=1 Tax=Sphingomonas oligophenolica TaxID=301154 RepID=A0ABU9Y8A1_9SPHN